VFGWSADTRDMTDSVWGTGRLAAAMRKKLGRNGSFLNVLCLMPSVGQGVFLHLGLRRGKFRNNGRSRLLDLVRERMIYAPDEYSQERSEERGGDDPSRGARVVSRLGRGSGRGDGDCGPRLSLGLAAPGGEFGFAQRRGSWNSEAAAPIVIASQNSGGQGRANFLRG